MHQHIAEMHRLQFDDQGVEAEPFVPSLIITLTRCYVAVISSFSVCLSLQGAELIPQLTSGDVIVSAELVSGQSRLTNAPPKAA